MTARRRLTLLGPVLLFVALGLVACSGTGSSSSPPTVFVTRSGQVYKEYGQHPLKITFAGGRSITCTVPVGGPPSLALDGGSENCVFDQSTFQVYRFSSAAALRRFFTNVGLGSPGYVLTDPTSGWMLAGRDDQEQAMRHLQTLLRGSLAHDPGTTHP